MWNIFYFQHVIYIVRQVAIISAICREMYKRATDKQPKKKAHYIRWVEVVPPNSPYNAEKEQIYNISLSWFK